MPTLDFNALLPAWTSKAAHFSDAQHRIWLRRDDPVGPADEALDVAAKFCAQRNGVLVAAWGSPKGNVFTRGMMIRRFATIAERGLPLHYLRLTPKGYPEHLLYLPPGLTPKPWHGVFA